MKSVLHKLKRFFGPTEITVGTIEADITPIPGLNTPEGEAEIRKFAETAIERAQNVLRDANLDRRSDSCTCVNRRTAAHHRTRKSV